MNCDDIFNEQPKSQENIRSISVLKLLFQVKAIRCWSCHKTHNRFKAGNVIHLTVNEHCLLSIINQRSPLGGLAADNRGEIKAAECFVEMLWCFVNTWLSLSLKLQNYQYTWANDKPDSLYNILAMVCWKLYTCAWHIHASMHVVLIQQRHSHNASKWLQPGHTGGELKNLFYLRMNIYYPKMLLFFIRFRYPVNLSDSRLSVHP
jgi:hypothetical protein